MTDIREILKVAARRLHATVFLSHLHLIAMYAAIGVLVVVVASKVTPVVSVPWIVAGPVIVGLVLVMAGALWMRSRMDDLRVAVEVDDRLNLREKLSTALHLRSRDDAFARAAVEDAIKVSRDAGTRERVRRIFRVEIPDRWWISPLLTALAVGVGLLLPQGDIFARSQPSQRSTAPVPAEVTSALSTAIEQIRQSETLESELRDVLDDLEPSSLDPEALTSPEAMKREAIKKLSSVNDELKKITEGDLGKRMEAIEKSLSRLKSEAESGEAKELTDALSTGDFKSAREALEKLSKKVEENKLTDAQSQQLKEQLEKLASQMSQLAQQQQALRDALQKAGMNPNLAQNGQQLQQALNNNQNLTQQQRQQLQQMAQSQQQATQMMQGLSQAMSQMAQSMNQQGAQNNNQSMSSATSNAQQMLSQMEGMQQMLQQAQAMASQLAGQCQGLGQGLGMKQGLMGGAFGGPGQGAGGEAPLAKTPTATTKQQANNANEQADVISNLPFDGPVVRGQSTEALKDAALSVAESYAQNVDESPVPRKYKDALQHYFGRKMREVAGEVGGSDAGSSSSTESDGAGPGDGVESDES